jgi:hypothetical protein
MKQEQIKRNLQSVGMSCFVRHFRMFSDRSISDSVAVETLRRQEGYAEGACRTRVSVSRRLIAEGYARPALYMVANAEKVDGTTRRLAQSLLEEFSNA